MAIEQFDGNTRWLSNMFRQQVGNIVLPEEAEVPTVEHYYHIDRFTDRDARHLIIIQPTGHLAKRMSRALKEADVPYRPDWKERRLPVMRAGNWQKYTRNPDLAELLLATGDETLIEGNDHGDRFFGVCPPGSNKGENWLGIIAMDIRDELRGGPPEGLHRYLEYLREQRALGSTT